MLTIWCCAISPLPSVNGIVNTVGRVPAARAVVNVGAVQLYSAGWTLTHGYLASNSLIWSISASTASWVAPGRRAPTVMLVGLWPAAGSTLADGAVVAAAAEAGAVVGDVEPQPASTMLVSATAANVAR